MSSSEAPSLLKSGHQVDQLWVVPKLGIDNFDVLGVSLHEEVLQIVETALNVGAKLANGDTLARTYLSTDIISNDEDRDIEVITTLPNTVRYLINLADLVQKLIPQAVILFICGCVENASTKSLLAFIATHMLNDSYGLGHMSPCIRLDRHQLSHVSTLIDGPILIKLLK